MLKAITVLAATVVAVFGASTLAGAAGGTSSKPKSKSHNSNAVTVVAVLGRRVNVPFHKFVMAFANCPKGYYVTGGGAYSGAINEVVSAPQANMRGWFIDGTNDAMQTFQHWADAVCVKGTRSVPIATAASSSSSIHQAEVAYAASHWGASGR